MALQPHRDNRAPQPSHPAEVKAARPPERELNRLEEEQLRSIIHERWREDARCVVELLTKLVVLVACFLALISGGSGEILHALKAALAAAFPG
jgi:hypothetical protein